ncbi:hypothetical protein [Blautia sp.]|uniref:hypothetical protein n=1 Tax=Blautia sp. TaxID=1955243 RepID=UPI00257AF4F1|nr:hypothetical protein [Blautia sp.]
MRNDELKEYLDEKRRQGLDEIGCWQVRIAANMGISREKLDFISIPGLSFTNREWTYLALLDQVPVELLAELPELTANGIIQVRNKYWQQQNLQNLEVEKQLEQLKQDVEKQLEESRKLCEFLFTQKELKEAEESAVEPEQQDKREPESHPMPVEYVKRPTWGEKIREIFYRRKRKKEEEDFILLLQQKDFSLEQKKYLIACREAGDSMDIIRNMAYTPFEVETMERIRNLLLKRRASVYGKRGKNL